MSWFLKAAIVATLLPAPLMAADLLSPTSLLGRASDTALDKLSRPGAFAADDAIRIGLPGPLSKLGGLAKLTDQAGITGNLTGSLNDAAGAAASAAKPIFRAAINKMSVSDMAGIVTGGGTAATDYLHRSAGAEITAKLAPLVRAALSRSGVMKQTSKLSSIGMTPDTINDYVTKKTADGIFTYMGREEAGLRANPLGAAKSIFDTMKH